MALFVGSLALSGRSRADAEDLTATGILAMEPDGYLTVTDGATKYSLISAMYLSPYLGKTTQFQGVIDNGLLYVRSLALGAMTLEADAGRITFAATGTVEEGPTGFEITVEGIVFTLLGSDGLGQIVGETATLEGNLEGTTVFLTRVTTSDGQEIEVEPSTGSSPPSSEGLGSTGGQPEEETAWGSQEG